MRRSQRTTRRRYWRWNHAKVRFRLNARDVLCEGAPTWFFIVPDPPRQLRPDPACPEAMAERLRVVPLIRREHLEPLTRSAPSAGADAAGVHQGQDVGPLVTARRRGARGQWHARRVREDVDEDPLALPALGHALTVASPRGKKQHRPRRRATGSARVPRPARAHALAWRRAYHQPASAAALHGPHSWRPMEGSAEDHTSGSP